jgi:hypothetical protein
MHTSDQGKFPDEFPFEIQDFVGARPDFGFGRKTLCQSKE